MSSDNPKFMRLADGTLIDTASGQKVTKTELNKAWADTPESEKLRAAKAKVSFGEGRRRYLDDLPLPADQSRAIALVAAYHIFGLNTADIAYVVRTEIEKVEEIKATRAFVDFIEAMLGNVREHDRDKVRKKINDTAIQAVEKVAKLVSSDDEKVALTASRDVLDRHAGTAANGGGSNAGGLVIRIIDDRDNPSTKVDVDIT